MDLRKAIVYARVAYAAYGREAGTRHFRLTAKFENKGTDTQGIFGVAYDDTAVIGFRGSEDDKLVDWITDAKFMRQVYPYGNKDSAVLVHYGFIEAYKSVRAAILQHAQECDHGDIVCAGHSLGGALAILATLDVQYNLPEKRVRCYTYGAPRVGNKAFVQSYEKRVAETYRFINGDDLVPALPPLSFHHVGQEIIIGERGSWADFAARFRAHLPAKYIEALQNLL